MPTSGRNSRSTRFISPQIIIEINREQIDRFGGAYVAQIDNLRNPGSLHYITQAIQNPLCEEYLYPTLFLKAAALGERIITGHVFFDGNKRTAFEAVRLFLFINGQYLRLDQEGIREALDIANGLVSLSSFAEWLKLKAIPLPAQWPDESSSGSP